MDGSPAQDASHSADPGIDGEEEAPIISPREGLQDRLRKARERRRRRASGDVVPGGEAATRAIPEVAMEGPTPPRDAQREGNERTADGSRIASRRDGRDMKANLARKRALLEQQRKQRKLDAGRILTQRQSAQMKPSSKTGPEVSAESGALFDEHDDQNDYGYGYGGIGGNKSFDVVLSAPNRWPATSATTIGSAPTANVMDDDEDRPPPVVILGGLDLSGIRSLGKSESERSRTWNARKDGERERRRETDNVRRAWVAARDEDECKRLLKEDEGLAVRRLPKAAPRLMQSGAFQDRLLRDAVSAKAEEHERLAWQGLQGGTIHECSDRSDATEDDIEEGVDHADGEQRDSMESLRYRAPSTTVFSGRGPSQVVDFFPYQGAPCIMEDPLEPYPVRVERPPADEETPGSAYFEASVRRPTAGIGPEARAAGLDERTELKIIVPRVAFHDHPLFTNEDRLSSSLRQLFGRYRAKMESDTEGYLRRRLHASLSALVRLRDENIRATDPSEAATGAATTARRPNGIADAVGAVLARKVLREEARWLLRDTLSTLASLIGEIEEVARLERAMNALWTDMEEDRRDKGFASTRTLLQSREVKSEGGDSESGNKRYNPDSRSMSHSRENRCLLSIHESLDELEDMLEWLDAGDATQQADSKENSGGQFLPGEKISKTAAVAAAENRRRHEEKEKLEDVIERCRGSLALAAEEDDGPRDTGGGAQGKSFVFRLSNNSRVTSDSRCGGLERARREKAAGLRYRVSVFVNGSNVSSSKAVPLDWPEFTCSFNHLVRLRLVRRPQKVMVSVSSCSTLPWWPDQVVASVWFPVPGGQQGGSASGAGGESRTTHAFAPRAQWSQFSAGRPMASSGPLAERRTCGSILVGTEWATSRDGSHKQDEGGVIIEGGDASAPALPVGGSSDAFHHITWKKLLGNLWTADGRRKLKHKPLLGIRSCGSGVGVNGGSARCDGILGGGRGVGAGREGDESDRPIPDFAHELDFLHLLPRGADVDPNDPRLGSVLRLHELLDARGLGRLASRTSGILSSGRGSVKTAGFGDDGEEEGFFRASQEQQVLVFRGKRPKARGASGFDMFHYNNNRRWKEPLRHTLIRLREKKPSLFGHHPIPHRDADIRQDESLMAIFSQEAAARAHRHAASGRRPSFGDGDHLDAELDEDTHKTRIAVDKGRMMDFVRQVRDSRTAQARRQALQRLTFASVVQEESVPHLGLDFAIGRVLPPRKRALRPQPKERAAAIVQIDQIISARNVPARACSDVGALAMSPVAARNTASGDRPSSPSPRERDDDFEVEDRVPRAKGRLCSFVEVQFQDVRKRTSVFEGLMPLWKETLDLPFTPPMADFSPANLAQVSAQTCLALEATVQHEHLMKVFLNSLPEPRCRLEQVRDLIIVSLFDEANFDDRSRGGYLEDETSLRREKRFLGSVTIPFQTVYQAGRVEGVLRMDVPPVRLGYDEACIGASGVDMGEDMLSTAGEGIARDGSGEGGGGGGEGVALTGGPSDPASAAALLRKADRSTYVKVLATLDPIPIVLKKKRTPDTNQESPGLVAAGERWVKRVSKMTNLPEGVLPVQLFVPDMFSNGVFVTRYLCPQRPPSGFNTVAKCAHFVRLLPFMEDWQIFEGVDDMWCTSQQFLDILAGDAEEHAVLLHNFILHLIMVKEGNGSANRRPAERTGSRTEVYIIIGHAVPEGDTVYVLVQELTRFGAERTSVIWKPSTGEGMDARDARCPLKDIACIVSQENVWACLRRNIRPCDLILDLNDSKTWHPFFSNPGNPAPSQGYTTIQEDIVYRPTQQPFVYEVEDLIREALKRDIRRWRSKRSHTAFNADVSNRLAELLPLLESQALTGETRLGKDEHRHRLENTMRSRDLVGFPLHSGFIDVDHLVQRVKAMGIHEAKHPEVQFALAVQVFPYPHNVLSVWIYIASITPR